MHTIQIADEQSSGKEITKFSLTTTHNKKPSAGRSDCLPPADDNTSSGYQLPITDTG